MMIFLLMKLLMLAKMYGADDTEYEINTRKCKMLLNSNPSSYPISFYNWNNFDIFGKFNTESGDHHLESFIKFHNIALISEGADVSSICAGIVSSTSYTFTHSSKGIPLASVTVNTRQEVAVGVVNVSTACWRTRRNVVDCNPVFIPMPRILNTTSYQFSPLREDFWRHARDDGLFDNNWIWRISVITNEGSIESSWVSMLNITSLKELQITGNDWGRPHKLLGLLPNLKTLDLTNNTIEVLPDDVFDNTPELHYIILGHNNISQLPRGIENLQRIHILDLTNPEGNASLAISKKDILTLTRIKTLGLERTRLHTDVPVLLSLPNLMFLNLSGCFLNDFQPSDGEYTGNTTDLRILDLSFNNLTYLPQNIFVYLGRLRELYLHHNFLNSCQNMPFGSLFYLEKLDLSRNEFITLECDCFGNLTDLKVLDLSHNSITSLESLIFRNLHSLQDLNLSYNKLSAIGNVLFLPLTNIIKLDLSFNRLADTPFLGEVNSERVDLSHNDLSYVTSLTKLAKYIKYLDLSWNHIRKLHIEKLNLLNLSYNSLDNIPEDMWEYIQEFPTTDLGGNNIRCCQHGISSLQEIMATSYDKIQNLNQGNTLTCWTDKDEEIALQQFHYNRQSCNAHHRKTQLYIVTAVIFSLSLITMFIVVFLLYFYRADIAYLLKTRNQKWRMQEKRPSALF